MSLWYLSYVKSEVREMNFIDYNISWLQCPESDTIFKVCSCNITLAHIILSVKQLFCIIYWYQISALPFHFWWKTKNVIQTCGTKTCHNYRQNNWTVEAPDPYSVPTVLRVASQTVCWVFWSRIEWKWGKTLGQISPPMAPCRRRLPFQLTGCWHIFAAARLRPSSLWATDKFLDHCKREKVSFNLFLSIYLVLCVNRKDIAINMTDRNNIRYEWRHAFFSSMEYSVTQSLWSQLAKLPL